MKVKATILCENSVFSNLGAMAEHGWSVYLETEQGNLLFDTGQGLALVNNSICFKKNLSAIQGIILSHHHVDHTGGLMAALGASGPTRIYAHPSLFKESYSLRGQQIRYIGIPFSKTALVSKGAEFHFNQGFQEILPGIYLTGEVPRETDYEKGDMDQVLLRDGQYVKDPLEDDQSLIIRTSKGLFVVLGCSHAGIVNILNYAIRMTGETRIHTVIGGTHLGPVSSEQREKSIDALQTFSIERIGVSHCTGTPAALKLSQVFGDRFFFCNVGTVVEAE